MLEINSSLTKGIGTIIGFLSLLTHYEKEVIFKTDNDGFNLLSQLIRIYDLKNIHPVIQDSFKNIDEISDVSKIFSRYISPSTINLFGKIIPNSACQINRKKFIGFAGYTNSNDVFTEKEWLEGDRGFPKNRQYSIESWAEIFKLTKLAGYDVITFDSLDINIETKIQMLQENCEAVIGYEGGIGHICHTLNIPFIMLPWRNGLFSDPDGEFRKDRSYMEQFLHLDKKTYFLESLNELLSWNADKLNEVIDLLKVNRGNNKVLQSPYIFMNMNMIYIKLKDNIIVIHTTLSLLEKNIIKMIYSEKNKLVRTLGGFNLPKVYYVDDIENF
jgi:hypothetical protein